MSAPLHSRLPPSSAYRWSECTASVSFIEANAATLPADGSREADEGTRAHAYLTACLKHTLGQVPDGPEMKNLMDALVDFIHGLMRPGDRLLVDQRVPLYYLPSQRGTLDVCIYGNGRIIILDLKYGVGVGVYAERNKQLAIYAESQIRVLELVEEYLPETPVELIIYQPRDRNDPTAVRQWSITRGELATFAEEIEVKAQVVLSGEGLEFKAGEACKFCRATGICKAYAARGLDVLPENVDVQIDMVHVAATCPQYVERTLTREQRQRILQSKKAMIEWLDAVENQEVTELLNGAEPQAFKLVEGKSNRIWADEQKAAKLLLEYLKHDDIYPPIPAEIVSPAQAEKLLKGVDKKILSPVITKPEGKPTLVPFADKRPALRFNPAQGFSALPPDARDELV